MPPSTIWFISKLFGTYYLTVGWAIYSSCLSLTVAVLNLYCVSIIERYVTFPSVLNLVAEVVYRWLNGVYLVVIVIEGIINRQRFKLTKNALNQIKMKTNAIVIKGIAGPILLWCVDCWTVTKNKRLFDFVNVTSRYMSMIMIRLVILQYVVLSKQLQKAFLKNQASIKLTRESIERSIVQYDLFCNVSDNIVGIFSTKLLLSITITFVKSVVYALVFIRRSATLLYTQYRYNFFWFKVYYLLPIVPSFLIVFQEGVIIVAASSSLKAQADDYLSTIDKLVMEDNCGNLAKNKMVRLLATFRRQVNITVYGLFTVDNALLFGLVQSALTYLIILVQFIISFHCDII